MKPGSSEEGNQRLIWNILNILDPLVRVIKNTESDKWINTSSKVLYLCVYFSGKRV